MKTYPTGSVALALFVVTSAFSGAQTQGAIITGSDIVAVPFGLQGSGNGGLDLRLFTSSTAANGAFDDGNTSLPGGGSSFAESYVTTVGDLRAFYTQQFPNPIDEIILFLDLDESNESERMNNTLAKLDVIHNPATIQGNPVASGDVSSAEQNAINQTYSGGMLLTQLFPEPAENLPTVNQGAGFADYAIFTGINPFSLSFHPDDVLLFNISMALLSNGGEEIFVSGDLSGLDIIGAIPEPATILAGALLLLPFGGAGIRILRRQKS